MNAFCFWPNGASIAVGVLATVGSIAQTALIVCMIFRYGAGRSRWEEILLESAVLLQTLLYGYLIAQARMNFSLGYAVTAGGAQKARWIVCALTTLYACAAAWRAKRVRPLVCAAVAMLTLPPAERLLGANFVFCYLFAVLFFLIRAGGYAFKNARRLKNEISAYSVKAAIDALESGVMFCAADGSVLLMNRRMREMIRAFTGRLRRNGAAFWGALETGACFAQRLPHEKKGEYLYRLADGRVILFTDQELPMPRRTCRQISASDVTEYWTATQELETQQKQLRERSEQLRAMLSCVQSVCRGEETLRMKSRFHDGLGQKIALFARTLSDGELPPQSFFTQVGELLQNGAAEPMRQDAISGARHMQKLQQIMCDIGVTVTFSGELPKDPFSAELFCDIMTETATNAVRHGLAEQISVELFRRGDQTGIRVTNDGAAATNVTLRGGLLTLKKKVEQMGGEFVVTAGERFSVEARIPAAESEEGEMQ